MKTRHPAFATTAAAAALLLPAAAHAAVINVTSVTYDDNGTSTAVAKSSTTEFDNTLKLESFTDGNTTWDEFVLVDSVSNLGSTSYAYGASASDPGSATTAVTDDRIDSAVIGVDNNSRYFFEAAPLSVDDVLFFFEFTGGNNSATIQLIELDGTQVGTGTFVTSNDDVFGKLDTNAFSALNMTLSAVPFSDFAGVTSANIGAVAGIEIVQAKDIDDPALVGFATLIPEPASLALIGVGSLLLLTTGRRRDA